MSKYAGQGGKSEISILPLGFLTYLLNDLGKFTYFRGISLPFTV